MGVSLLKLQFCGEATVCPVKPKRKTNHCVNTLHLWTRLCGRRVAHIVWLQLMSVNHTCVAESSVVKENTELPPPSPGIQRNIIALTRTSHWSLSWARWIYTTCFRPTSFQIHSDIILPSTFKSFKWVTSFKPSNQERFHVLTKITMKIGEERTNRWHKYRCLITIG